MQKKVLALAVAAALAPAAAVAQSTVEIYGRANLGVDQFKATGATLAAGNVASRVRVYDQGSRLGFRVNESLGGGMRAFVVLESGVNFDTGNNLGQAGSANASAGFFASRDSYAGIGGDWGDVRFGRQSIWWSNGIIAQTSANYINTSVDGMTTGGFQAVAVPTTRTSNVFSYNSPTMGGFNASLSWAPNGNAATTTEASQFFTGSGQEKESVWGITGRYTGGALRAQLDWATHKHLAQAGAVQREDKGLKWGLGWAYAPGSQISYVGERIENDNAASLFGVGTETRKVTMHLINLEHMMGQWQLLAQYVFTGNIKGLNADPGSTKAKGFTLAAKYFMSKRTGVYASLNVIKNEANAWADYTGGNYSSGGGGGGNALSIGNRGADPRALAVGIMHNF